MILVFVLLLGLAVGSFLNVLIDRLPNEKSLLGRSHCDHCKKTLEPIDLIPFLSFIFLQGRCRRCKKQLSFQYPAIELLTAMVFVFTWLHFQSKGIDAQIAILGLMAAFIAMFFSDLKYQILPDEEQIALLIFTIVYFISTGSGQDFILFRFVEALVIMGVILALFLVTRGKGMGFGDVKLAYGLGFLHGIQGGLVSLYLAFIIGGTYGMLAILFRKRGLKSKVAFGPFLIIGGVLYLFFSTHINTQLHTIFGI